MASPLRARTALVLASLAILPRCACDTVPRDAIEDCAASQVVPGAVATDILFVIDDSQSMSEEQTLLRNALANFIRTLDASPVANDFQIGVTSTSVADFGGAPTPPAGDLVSPGVMHAADANLVTAFEAAVVVGTTGSSREQPFEAARLAIVKSEPGGANEGFLRPGARLAIIFLSDEDDCSGPEDAGITASAGCRAAKVDPASTLLPIGDFASFLGGPLAGERRDVIVAAIAGVAPGTLEPSCGAAYCSDTACGTAMDKADRFIALLGAVGPSRTRLASICDASFDQALSDFAGAILSKTLPLDGAPADWHMLVARVERPGVGTIGCAIAPATADATTRAAADAIYEAPQAGRPASLTFQNDCALQQGDRVDVQVVCAG